MKSVWTSLIPKFMASLNDLFGQTNMGSPVVSFDFDGVLTHTITQDFAKEMHSLGFRIMIITTRPHSALSSYQDNSDLYAVANKIGCNMGDIIFTHDHPKEHYLSNSRAIFHMDDDTQTVSMIESCVGMTRGLIYMGSSSIKKAKELIINSIKRMSGHDLFQLNSKLTPEMTCEYSLAVRNAFQKNGMFHGLTCCSHDGCNRTEQPNYGLLEATESGWVCPCGIYTQDF